jgi:hypothetical protein
MTDEGTLCVVKQLLDDIDPHLFGQIILYQTKRIVSGDLAKMIQSAEVSEEIYLQPMLSDTTPFIVKRFDNHNTLKGNGGRVTIQYSLDCITQKRLLIFGDSFFYAALHLLAPFFKEILFIRTPFFYKELVKLFKPDIIFSVNAERYLQSTPYDLDSNFFFFENYFKNTYKPDLIFSEAFSAQLSYTNNTARYLRWANNTQASLHNEKANRLIADSLFLEAAKELKYALNLKPNNLKIAEKLNQCLGNS